MAIVTFNNTNNSLCNLTVTLNANPSQPIVVNGVTFPYTFDPTAHGFGANDTDGLYTFNCADCRYDHIVEGGNITTTTTTSTTSTTSTSSTTSTTSTSTTTTTTTIDPTVDVELRWLINSEGTDTLQLLDDNSTYTPLRVEPFSYNNSTLGTVLLSVEVDALNGFEFTGVDGELTYEINGVPIVSGESNIQHNIAGFTANYNSTNEVWSLTIAITGQSPYGELVDGEVFILEIFGDAITTTTTTEFVPPEFLCGDASPIIAMGEVGQEVVLSQPLSEGVLEGIAPQYYVEGDQTYTVEIKIPAGYQDVGQSIFCDVNAIGFTTTTSTTTLPTLLCEDVDIVIGGGLEGTPVIDTVTTDIGTVDSVIPENFVEGTNDYMVTILLPQGYDSDTLVCEVSGIGATTTTTTTLPTLECRDIVITIPDGTEGDTITASATLDGANLTIQQIEHSGSVVTEYMAGFVQYDVIIVVPDGFNNPEPTIDCPFTAFGFAQTTTTTTIEETTTTTTLPAFDCDLVTVKFGGSNPTDGEEIPYGEFTIQVTGYSGDPIVITDIQPAYYDVNQSVYQVTFIIPEGYQGAGTEFTCDSMEITVDPTTTTTTTIEETTTTTTTESVQSYIVRACCDSHEGNPTIHGFVELPTTYTGGEQVSIDGVCYTVFAVGGSNPHIPTTVVDYNDCDECTSSPSTVNCVVETTSTTTEEITSTTTESVVYETYEITPCCDNTDPTAVIHQYVELPNTYIVSDVLSINNVCYTITKVSTGPNPLTPTSIVDYETCDDCVQDDNNFGCVYTYEACAETTHGHGNLMVNPDKINIIENQIYGETVFDKLLGFEFTNNSNESFEVRDCYSYVTYDSNVEVVSPIYSNNTNCEDTEKCGAFNMLVENCTTGRSAAVQISMVQANELDIVSGDTITSAVLANAILEVGGLTVGNSDTCYTVGGRTNFVNSRQDGDIGTYWTDSDYKTAKIDSCFDTGCGCKKNFTVTNTSSSTFNLRYKTCSGVLFEPVMGPFGSITFNDDDCVNMNTIWIYSKLVDEGESPYNNKIEISGPYEDCASADRNVSTTTTTLKDNPVTTTTTTEEPTTTTTTTVQTEFTTTYRFVFSGSGYEVKNGNTSSDSVITEMVFGPHSAGSTIPNNQQFWIVSTTGHPFTSIYNSTGGNQASAYSLDGLSIQRSLIQGSVLCSVGPQSTQANSDVIKTIYIQSDGGPEPTTTTSTTPTPTTTTTTTQVVTTTTTNSNESAYEFERCSEQSVVRILISDWTGDVPVMGNYYKVDSGNGEECVEYVGITQPSKYHSFVSASGPFDSCETCVGTTTTTTTELVQGLLPMAGYLAPQWSPPQDGTITINSLCSRTDLLMNLYHNGIGQFPSVGNYLYVNPEFTHKFEPAQVDEEGNFAMKCMGGPVIRVRGYDARIMSVHNCT